MSDNDPPPVLTKQITCGATTTADNSMSIVTCISATTLTSSTNDSFTKTTTIVTPSSSSSSVSDSTQLASASSNTSVSSSSKSLTSDNRNATNVIAGSGGTTATITSASSSNAETASSTSSTPQPAPKSRRKPTSRAKKDAADKTKTTTVVSSSSTTQMVPQAPLMLTSASPGQFMLVHHNGQCYMMSAAQYFGANQQIAAVRPQQQQQQQFCTPTTSCTSTITTSAQDFFKVIQQQQAQSFQNSTNLVSASQPFYTQQQYRHTHPAWIWFSLFCFIFAVTSCMLYSFLRTMPSQQQYVQPSFVANSATLGQLARNLAPKPSSGPGSVATSTHIPSTTVTTTTTTTSSFTVGQGNDASSGRSTQQQQSPQQLGTTAVQQMQPSMFSQGIQLRAPPGSSGIVFQMPSGAYTYVHQLVTPQQRTSIAIPQQQSIPACIGQAVASSQPQNQQPQQLSPSSSPNQKIVASTTGESKNKQTSSNTSKESTAVERKGSNASPTTDRESQQQLAQMVSVPSKPPTTPVKSNEAASKNVRGNSKHSGNGRKTSAVKIAAPQPIAPSNLVPVGAPVPMMVMSAPMPQLSSFGGHAAVPFMGPNGQIIHQQLIANPPVPTHQMIPVFQQPQQSAAHFPISQSTPTQVQDATSHDFQKTVGDDDNSFADSGIENEPPPLLVQGESKDAFDIHMMFTREAERYYQKTGRKGKIVHLIEGFEIEESDEPFPCDPPCRLSDWLLSEIEDKNGKNISKERRWTSRKLISEKNKESTLEISAEKVVVKKGRAKASPTKSEASSEKAEKKTRKRKTNELDRLLQMDFGPSHGRLSDIMQKSVYKPTKESKETLPPPPLPPATKSGSTKPKGRPPSSSVDKQKSEKIETSEPVMERFIIEDAADMSPKAVTKKCEESPATVDQSLNSSKSSADTATGSLLVSFSDEELDTERCNYCNGLLRLKRLENHPQYCSKKCRKLWKKNPAISEEQVGRSFNASPRLPVIHSTDTTSPNNKDISPTVTVQNLSIVSEPSSSGSTVDLQQRTPPTLTLKMVSPQQAEIVKSPRGLSTSYSLGGECSKMPSTSVSPAIASAAAVEHAPMDFLSRPTKTWTCDEVASWVSSVTGNEDCANTFRNQDIDGQSLLLLPDNAHNNLVTLLGLKLGPVVKILNALKELSSKSINSS
uniref:SAM domain-containing protein n=1 Tax=Elaeophora elaphi TaxID=1147741 RepID=A0A158Q7F3_9BILA